jgi:HTH-type transcriptional regulator, competence development regulator
LLPATELGKRLRAAREEAGLSLRQVQEATGIHNAHLSQVESGAITRPEMSMLFELASLYGIDYTELLVLAGYAEEDDTSGRQRSRMSAAMRAMGELSPKEQNEVLDYMAKLLNRRTRA